MGRGSETPYSDSTSPLTSFSTTNPITGELSFRQFGSGGSGYRFSPEPTQMRMGLMFNTKGGLEDIAPIKIYCRESGGQGYIQFAWRNTKFQADLKYFDADGDTDVDAQEIDTTPYKFLHSNAVDASICVVAKVGSGGYASVYFNGVKVLYISASALGLAQASSIHSIIVGETGAGFLGLYETHFDDWYIDTGGGSETDEAPPTNRFSITRPSGAGSSTNWNPTTGSNYQTVDEQIGDDDDYNYTSVVNDDDRFAFSNISLPSNSTINAAIPIVRARAGSPFPQLKIRTVAFDGLVSQYGTVQELRLGYTYIWDRMTTEPGGGSWSESDVNSAEFGYELRT